MDKESGMRFRVRRVRQSGKEGEEGLFSEPYGVFAEIYDSVMDHVPYRRWAEYLAGRAGDILGSPPRSVLDLGCGTGMILKELGKVVPLLHGLDRSASMLERARARIPGARFQVALLEGPIPYEDRSFPWMISTHDSINYLIDTDALESHLREVGRVLSPGGLYSMDAVTLDNILRNFAGKTTVRRAGSSRLHWTNSFDDSTNIMRTVLTFFLDREHTYEEVHLQRYYSPDEIRILAAGANLELVFLEGDYFRRAPLRSDSMMNFQFRKRKR